MRQHHTGDKGRRLWFLGLIRRRPGGHRVGLVGEDVKIPVGGGRVKTFPGARYSGPLSDSDIRAIERAGYGDRLCPHPPGSEAASRWEEALPVLPPDPLASALSG